MRHALQLERLELNRQLFQAIFKLPQDSTGLAAFSDKEVGVNVSVNGLLVFFYMALARWQLGYRI